MVLCTRTNGSLGRLVSRDPGLCWIVTTVACLFQYHKEVDIISFLKTLLETNARPETDPEAAFKYHAANDLVFSRVIKSITESVWFNVVNAGHATACLPEELASVCQTGHYVDNQGLASVVSALQKKRPKVMIRTEYLPRNLTHWLILHFDGEMRVTVSSKVIYRKILGNAHLELEIRVEQFCDKSKNCAKDGSSTFDLIEDVAGNFEELLSRRIYPASESPPEPRVRRHLYELPRSHPLEHEANRPSIQLYLRAAAQEITKWLVKRPVLAPLRFTNFGFSVSLDDSKVDSQYKVIDILQRSPNILNLKYGNVPRTKFVFSDAKLGDFKFEPGDSESKPRLDPRDQSERQLHEILPWFPILGDLILDVKQHCKCQRCDTERILPGCLQYTALVDCLGLLAHSIADGFGVTDVSGALSSVPLARGMLQLLLDLVEEQAILWSMWFGISTSVLLGCDCPGVPF